ncbi:MAG: GTP cyclohydrolase I FolE, partial [Chloroflexi bacterium]
MTEKLRSASFRSAFELDYPTIDLPRIETAVYGILQAVGEDVDREGLRNTPQRVARMYDELLSGYRTDPAKLLNDAIFSIDHDDLVIVRNIEFSSLCEHHMLPFLGQAHVAYIPRGKVIGLSKIPRIVDMFSHRLQLQERLTRQIADFIEAVLEPQGVAVILEGKHMCATIRGVEKLDSIMTTSA